MPQKDDFMGKPFTISGNPKSWIYLRKSEEKLKKEILNFVVESLFGKNKNIGVPITHIQKAMRKELGASKMRVNAMVYLLVAQRTLAIKQWGRNRIIF